MGCCPALCHSAALRGQLRATAAVQWRSALYHPPHRTSTAAAGAPTAQTLAGLAGVGGGLVAVQEAADLAAATATTAAAGAGAADVVSNLAVATTLPAATAVDGLASAAASGGCRGSLARCAELVRAAR